MSPKHNFKDALGQHMTPSDVANLLAANLPRPVSLAVDLAVGNGALLEAVRRRFADSKLWGADFDNHRIACARAEHQGMILKCGDGLDIAIPQWKAHSTGGMSIIGNPPFLPADPDDEHVRWQHLEFSDVHSKHGARRLEMSFLARALHEGRARSAIVAMVMPLPLASGLMYSPYRASLMKNHGLLKVITINDTRYRNTEAATVLVIIDTALKGSSVVEISEYDKADGHKVIYEGSISPGDRLDASFWKVLELHKHPAPRLQDVGVEISRGRFCNAEALRMHKNAIHTTHLAKLMGLTMQLPSTPLPLDDDVLAETGDILLSRTGSRVNWQPIQVMGGVAPITDHVLRIRAPKHVRDRVVASFRHPSFPAWLRSVTTGVCASVITKHDILRMPLFAA